MTELAPEEARRLPRRPDRAVRRAGPRTTRAASRPRSPTGCAPTCPSYAGGPSEVAALGLPLTLNHNDLHENNVFDVDGRLRFFDFGDSLLTEPLGVLLIPLNILGDKLEADGDDPRLWRVADAALEVWSDLVPARRAARRAAGSAPARPAGPGRVVGALPAVAARTTSSPSGARSPRPGSGRSTRTRRCRRHARSAVRVGVDAGVAERAGHHRQGGAADERRRCGRRWCRRSRGRARR